MYGSLAIAFKKNLPVQLSMGCTIEIFGEQTGQVVIGELDSLFMLVDFGDRILVSHALEAGIG